MPDKEDNFFEKRISRIHFTEKETWKALLPGFLNVGIERKCEVGKERAYQTDQGAFAVC